MAEAEIIDGGPIFVDVSTGLGNISEELTRDVQGQDDNPGSDNNETTVSKKTDPYLMIQTRRIRCTECNHFTAENEEKMLRHVRKMHRGENPFQCYMCDYSTYNKSLFEEHVRIHQGIKPFKCSQCPYRSVSKKNTKKHELIHRPNNPLKCTHCDFIARHSRSFVCHMRKHKVDGSKTEKIKCVKCNIEYNNEMEYKFHMKSRKTCKECNFVSCSKVLLDRHVCRNPEKQKKNQDGHFVCAICSWSSRSKARILLHLIHHPDQDIDESKIDVSILREHDIIK